MATGVLDNVYLKFDGAITGLYASASSGISSYVIPIAWIVLAVLLLVWCYLTMTGKTSMPVLDLFVPFIAFMLVLYAMGSGYTAWIADPLYKLPEELVSAVGRGSATTPIQALALFDQATAHFEASGKPVSIVAPTVAAKDMNELLEG